ncbi:hypothetical protein QR680_013899 [Steinernema hermaphroditum]|uniref:G-protein coupled receptors family 1 profile domain-containing protein n=1 Tax=Steinernema hermaphroditum TaxID=289476 RepID=A0AA39I9T8_9BILA|nr:hypothetical protein QR680_013899 [Steinernema hermaphroditum]
MDYHYYFNAYGFLVLGTFLVIFNVPVLAVVLYSRKLRNQYGVIIITLFNSSLIGVVCTGNGIWSFVLYATGRQDDLLTIAECFYNPLTFLFLWTFPMAGLGLLLNSIDRFLVITFPISYFHYNTKLVGALNIIAIITNAMIVLGSCYISSLHRPSTTLVNVFCNQNEIFTRGTNIFLTGIKAVFALLAILLMFVVLVIFLKCNRTKPPATFLADESIKRFKAKQMKYTKTMLISCAATLVIFIAPSMMAVVAIWLQMSPHMYVWTRFVCFLNFFNITILLIYRQSDIRWKLFKIVNFIFCKKLSLATSDGTLSFTSHHHAVNGLHSKAMNSRREM